MISAIVWIFQKTSDDNPYDVIVAAEPAVLENVALSDLHIQDLLCSGSYAKTYRGVFNGQACAVKRVRKLTIHSFCFQAVQTTVLV